MGGERTKVNTSNKVEATPEERQLNQLQLSQAQAFDPIQRQLNQNGGNLVNQLLTGQALPGYLQGLPGGINEDVTNNIVQQSLRDVGSQFNQNGILDSGVRQSIGARTAADIRTQSAQFNLQNLQQLLNLGVGGQAQVQQPMLGITGQLGGRLSGLRSTMNSQNTLGMNPFLKSFQQSAGQTLGSPKVAFGPFSFGGS